MSEGRHPGRSVEGSRLPGVGRQAIEGNPLTAEEITMFEMFEREDWPPERRRTHILALQRR